MDSPNEQEPNKFSEVSDEKNDEKLDSLHKVDEKKLDKNNIHEHVNVITQEGSEFVKLLKSFLNNIQPVNNYYTNSVVVQDKGQLSGSVICGDQNNYNKNDSAASAETKLHDDQFYRQYRLPKDVRIFSFLVALAVLNGERYSLVVRAEQMLVEMLTASMGKDEIQNPNDWLPRGDRLSAAKAVIYRGSQHNELGNVSLEYVKFENVDHSLRVLEFVWNEYDFIRGQLVEWLISLVDIDESSVLDRVSAAVGYLSTYDFTLIKQSILIHWANQPKASLKIAAVLALQIPFSDNGLRVNVENLINHWATLADNPYLNEVAAIAYGTPIGAANVTKAIERFESLAKNQYILLESLYIGISGLLQFGRESSGIYGAIFDLLLNWVNSKDRYIKLYGRYIFLFIAQNEIVLDKEKREYPTLIWLAQHGSSQVISDIITVWRICLNEVETRGLALNILKSYVQAANQDKEIFVYVENLITQLCHCGSYREVERLAFHIGKWARDKSKPLEAATQILKPVSSIMQISKEG